MYSKAVFLAALSVYGVIATDVNQWPSVEKDHTKLQFVVPSSLQKKGGYTHKDALFGYPAYSTGSIQAQLVYVNGTGCKAMNLDHLERPFVLMVDRGGCRFVEKIRNGQRAGAGVVLVADNTCLCSDLECVKKNKATICETVLPFMSGDGSAGDVTIPSMLIKKNDADAVKAAYKLKNGVSNVMVKFDWGIPSPDGRVEWTMWHSAWDEQSLMFMKAMEKIVLSLGKKAFFTPRFVSYNGTRVGCHVQSSLNPCGNMCLNRGRYCLLDPSPYHDQRRGASGADVVLENLRRKCIWKQVSKTDPGVGKKWWRYVNEFGDQCNKNEKVFMDHKCAVKVMKHVGLNVDDVENCMKPYGPDVNEVNPLLEEELKQQTALQLLRLPAVYVDGVHQRGRIDSVSVLSMICAGYGSHQPPPVCHCTHQSPLQMMNCVKQGGFYSASDLSSSVGFGFGQFMFIIVIVSCAVAGAGFVYWRRTQQHMREQVRSILAEYMPLEDQSAPGELDSPRGMHPAAVASAKSPRGFLPTTSFPDDEDDDGV